MKSNWLVRTATRTARGCLFAGAVALLVASWSGVAQADDEQFNIPEISLSAMGGAMTLLAGGLMLVRERLRSR